MKRLILFIVLITIFEAYPKTLQRGQVIEYDSKGNAKGLSGVTLIIKNAGSTISEKNGNFVLEFPNMVPGDRVIYEKIYKNNYELINIDAVKQWNLNPNELFQIIMRSKSNLNKVRKRVTSASANYSQEYKNAKKENEALKKQNKIQETEFRKKQQEYEKRLNHQLSQIHLLADHFIRTLTPNLPEEEQEIARLLENGRFEEAFERYDALNITKGLEHEEINPDNADIITISNSKLSHYNKEEIDSILRIADREINNLMLIGSRKCLDKVRDILFDITEKIPSSAEWQYKTAEFIYYYFSDYDKVLEYCNNALKVCHDNLIKADTYALMGNLKMENGENSEAEKYLYEAIKCWYTSITNKEITENEQSSNFKRMYFVIDAAEELTEEDVNSYELSSKIFDCYNNLANVYANMYTDLEACMQIDMASLLIEPKLPDMPDYLREYYKDPFDCSYYDKNNNEANIEYYTKYLRYLDEKEVSQNDIKRAETYIHLGISRNIYEKPGAGIPDFEKATAIYTNLFGEDYSQTLDCWIRIANEQKGMGFYHDAIKTLQTKVIPYAELAFSPNDISRFNINYILGESYFANSEWALALEKYLNALKYQEKYDNTDGVIMAVTLIEIGKCHFNLSETQNAKEVFQQAKRILEEYEGANEHYEYIDEINRYLDQI